jgi:hypothetical protein
MKKYTQRRKNEMIIMLRKTIFIMLCYAPCHRNNFILLLALFTRFKDFCSLFLIDKQDNIISSFLSFCRTMVECGAKTVMCQGHVMAEAIWFWHCNALTLLWSLINTLCNNGELGFNWVGFEPSKKWGLQISDVLCNLSATKILLLSDLYITFI